MTQFSQQDIAVNGITLHITTCGEGPLVVFCHGFPGHWSHWQYQMQAVADAGFMAVAPDMRGYGKSTRPDSVEAHDMNQQMADMLGLLDALDQDKAIFVGQDFGAPLVWSLAQQHPEKVAAVIGVSVPFDHDYYGRSCMGHLSPDALSDEALQGLLVASPLNPPSVGFNTIAQFQFFHAQYFQKVGVADKELGHHAKTFLTRLYWGLSSKGSLGDWTVHPSEGTGYLDVLPEAPALPWAWLSDNDMDAIVADYLIPGEDKAFFGGLASYRVADRNWELGADHAAKNIDVPALFIAGKNDPVMATVTDETLARVGERVPQLAGNIIVEDAGHFVQLEQPKATSDAIVEFIRSLKQ